MTVGKGKIFYRVLRAIRAVGLFMSKMTDEERARLLVELDKVNTEIKSLSSKIRGIANTLGNITNVMTDYVLTYAERRPGSYFREPPPWEPSNFDLSQLKNDYARLQELVAKRNGLEGRLEITIK